MTEDEKKQKTALAIDILTRNYRKLTSREGVTGAGAGLRMKEGKFTDEICIFIEVEKKKPLSELSENEIIPARIENIRIDIIEKRNFVPYILRVPIEEVLDPKVYRPLVGGSQITNGIEEDGLVEFGTLGCIVHMENTKNPYLAIMSNHHVLYAKNAPNGQAIGQPGLLYDPAVAHNETWLLMGKADESREIDFAVAKLVDNVKGSNEVLGIGNLTGISHAYVGQRVRKYGITTTLTTGIVTNVRFYIHWDIDTNNDFVIWTGLFIQEGYPKPYPNGRFSDEGDSGAVIVADDNTVIGLLWGGDDKVPDTTWANDIRDLLWRVGKIQIPITQTFQMQQIFSDTARLEKYKKMLEQTNYGQTIMKALLRNVDEMVKLSNHNRECLVAWRRFKGPQFISLRKNLSPDEPFCFERKIEEVSIEDMFSTMMNLYKKHGSDSLRSDLEKYGEELFQYFKQSESLEDLINFINSKDRS